LPVKVLNIREACKPKTAASEDFARAVTFFVLAVTRAGKLHEPSVKIVLAVSQNCISRELKLHIFGTRRADNWGKSCTFAA
jgi:hypothetical protein